MRQTTDRSQSPILFRRLPGFGLVTLTFYENSNQGWEKCSIVQIPVPEGQNFFSLFLSLISNPPYKLNAQICLLLMSCFTNQISIKQTFSTCFLNNKTKYHQKMFKIKDTQFCVKNLKRKRKKDKIFLIFRSGDLKPRFSAIF